MQNQGNPGDNEEDQGGGDGEGSIGSLSLVPGFSTGANETGRSAEDKIDEAELDIMKPNVRAQDAEPTHGGPPFVLVDGHGRLLENGYTVVAWDDGFFYLYDEDGNLVTGERFADESEAEDRAFELKPPGPRL